MSGRKRKVAPSPVPAEADMSYSEKRKRNNMAVTKSREKSRQLEAETTERVKALKDENNQLERRVEVLNRELAFLKEMFVAYASGKGASKADADADFASLATDASGPSANTRSTNDDEPSSSSRS